MAEAEFSSAPTGNACAVFVSNLAWATTSEGLHAHFANAGEIASAEVRISSSGRSQGWGIVEYTSPGAAQQAIATLNQTELDGRDLIVREDRGARAKAPREQRAPRPPRQEVSQAQPVARRVYIGNLPWRTSWQDLKDHFGTVGPVVYSNVMRGRDGRSKGYGIVEFEDTETAERAIATMDGTDLDGRTIYVREDREDKELQGDGGEY